VGLLKNLVAPFGTGFAAERVMKTDYMLLLSEGAAALPSRSPSVFGQLLFGGGQ